MVMTVGIVRGAELLVVMVVVIGAGIGVVMTAVSAVLVVARCRLDLVMLLVRAMV